MIDDIETFLQNIKVGDSVIVRNGAVLTDKKVNVDRVTKIHVVANGIRFRKADGRPVAAGVWSRVRLLPVTGDS